MQAARHFVSVSVELAASVQLRQHDFGGGDFLLLVDVDGDAAPVVNDGDRIIHVNKDFDAVAVAGEGFVNRVVDDFVDKVMQADLAGRADIHRRAFAHCIPPFEDGD